MTHGSVFSGIGGPEVAASMLGWENLFHCEINPFGRKILDYYYPNAESYEDITKTDFTKWRGRVNVLTGGFPCQPFSFAGKRKGADDERYLWPHMHRCIAEIQPDWVVCENVGGILTMVEQGSVAEVAGAPSLFDEDDSVHRYEYRGTFTIERICCDLEADGYAVQPILIPACSVGAPHRRDRVFIVGHRREDVADTDGSRRQESEQPGRSAHQAEEGSGLDDRTQRPCTDGTPTDTRDAGFQEARAEQQSAGTWGYALRSGEWVERLQGLEVAGCERWDGFPSVSPVHRGNDGIPFNVDDLTIPFNEWRNESIKAYGNAIVPQVMYEIFRAIEIAEKRNT